MMDYPDWEMLKLCLSASERLGFDKHSNMTPLFNLYHDHVRARGERPTERDLMDAYKDWVSAPPTR